MQNRCKFFRKLVASLLALFVSMPLQGYAQTSNTDLCAPSGYVLGFFNGVWNTRLQAEAGREVLARTVGPKYKNEAIEPELFYNTSGTEPSRKWVSGWEDIAEVFDQRSAEMDGILGTRWELFWEVLGGDQSLWDTLSGTISSVEALKAALIQVMQARAVATLSGLASSPPTAGDYAIHETRIKALATERKKLLFVAHSQGNFFVNNAYQVALGQVKSNNVKVVHIAPASGTLNGPHTLAAIDLVINGLRLTPGSTIPGINSFIPPALIKDWSGHKLVETYLDRSRTAHGMVREQMLAALDGLETPATTGSSGFFTVTLTWDGPGDVDLHSFEPNGSHVFYSARAGTAGFLDVDNVVANGPEHYYASCDASKLLTGKYRFGINNYARAAGRTATVQIASAANGELLTKVLGVGPVLGSGGNSSPIPVFEVVISKDLAGKYSIAAN
ncbi:hypothetical protein P3W85_14600 [Cupriavidus basilensis]|uniref:Uncharacterized protein n=1 Tax=Cupriavidus basilensis TaxID=68895 RepID=A0ABT6AR21_9BURK|nr:hypothetical protein [Cupriavidus basilensis]MDF3834176.1 hypothetical protein [Cupriavidus basilensis]